MPHLDRLAEREIMRHVTSGASNDEIAAVPVASPATVRTHVSRAMVEPAHAIAPSSPCSPCGQA